MKPAFFIFPFLEVSGKWSTFWARQVPFATADGARSLTAFFFMKQRGEMEGEASGRWSLGREPAPLSAAAICRGAARRGGGLAGRRHRAAAICCAKEAASASGEQGGGGLCVGAEALVGAELDASGCRPLWGKASRQRGKRSPQSTANRDVTLVAPPVGGAFWSGQLRSQVAEGEGEQALRCHRWRRRWEHLREKQEAELHMARKEALVKWVVEGGRQDGEGGKLMVSRNRRKVRAPPLGLPLQSRCGASGTSLGSWKKPYGHSPCAYGWL